VLSPAGFVMMAGMIIAGKTVGKGDPRLMVMLGYIATALGLFNLTRLDLTTSFNHAMLWRMLQVVGLPFIFIPISTLNYVGVPREKSNQISSLSNFARNLGGSAGTALLTTYLARSAQVHQSTLAANLAQTSQTLRSYIQAYAAAAHLSVNVARPLALASVYRQMQVQASMLAYKNAFAILALTTLLLSPLVWIMRLPPKVVKKPAAAEAAKAELEPMAAH
jgi:DHA2 family multidrug resistance protein